MNTTVLVITILLVAATLVSFAGEDAAEPAPKTAAVVGTFDSRAIAIAYASSEWNKKYLEGLKQRLEGAKEHNDLKKMKRIEAEAVRRQQEFHLMAFSADSVRELLEPVKDKLPALAKETGVNVIVSKWEVAHRDPALKMVDVTNAMVELFDPDEKVLGWVKGLEGKDPVPRTQILMMKHDD